MPADYKSHGAHNERRPLPGFVWLFIGLAIGLFVALIVYLDKQPVNDLSFSEAVQQELDALKQKNRTVEPVPETVEETSQQEPTFNFYTLLPELEVLIPESEMELDKATDEQERRDLASGKQYILQAGSFKHQADADKLRASLVLTGLDSSIQAVSINGERWHRVRVGPFDNKRSVYEALNQLQSQGINAMAMELKP